MGKIEDERRKERGGERKERENREGRGYQNLKWRPTPAMENRNLNL